MNINKFLNLSQLLLHCGLHIGKMLRVNGRLTTDKMWRVRPLLIGHLIIVLLLSSLYLPIWDWIDQKTFWFFNNSLIDRPLWHNFWALANHWLADWVEDLCIFGFYAFAIARSLPNERRQKIWQFLFCVLFIALTIFIINRLLCRDLLKLRRDSPTLAFEGCARLSQLVPWLEVKDISTKSFPGDHATTPLLFAATFAFYAGRRFGIYAFILAGFFSLPRLIAGAHWMSDLVVGSGSIVLFAMSWLLFTPLGKKGPLWVEKLFSRKRPLYRT